MPPIPVLVALADATRCRIITILRDGPQPVHALAAGFDISRPAISRHLRVLKQAGVISEDKKGRENLYRLHADALGPVHAWIGALLPLDEPVAQVAAVTPVLEAEPVMAAPPHSVRLRKPAPVSQMGFDF